MKIGFCTVENSVDSVLDQRFGRANWFLVTDEDGKLLQSIENTGKNEREGAGIAAVQTVVDNGIDVVIAPSLGPKALSGFKSLGVDVYQQKDDQNISSLIKLFKEGKLDKQEKPLGQKLYKV